DGSDNSIQGTGTVNINGNSCSNCTVSAGSNAGGIFITVNGQQTLVLNGQSITPAEQLAVVQKSTGAQTLTLNGTGNASGGSFTVSAANLPGGNFTNLILPTGVTENVSVGALTYTG